MADEVKQLRKNELKQKSADKKLYKLSKSEAVRLVLDASERLRSAAKVIRVLAAGQGQRHEDLLDAAIWGLVIAGAERAFGRHGLQERDRPANRVSSGTAAPSLTAELNVKQGGKKKLR